MNENFSRGSLASLKRRIVSHLRWCEIQSVQDQSYAFKRGLLLPPEI